MVIHVAGSPIAIAQDATATGADTVYVYGRSLESTLPAELARYGSDLVTLGRQDIEENLYVDPQQMLQMEVPGLYLTNAGPFSYNYISIQGSRMARYGPSDVLWLVDGVRLNNRLYPSTNTDTLPANMVERIEILKGGESLFYGTSAAGGVINIVSRDFTDSFDGDVSISTDSNDSYNVSGMARGAAGPGNFVVFASKDDSDGYKLWNPAEPSATDLEQSYDVTNIGGKYGFNIADDMRFVAQLQHTEATIDDLRPDSTLARYNERDEEIVSLKFDYAPEAGAQFFLKAYFHDWDSFYTRINNNVNPPGPPSGASDIPWGFEDEGINALGKFRTNNGPDFLVGYDYQRYSAADEEWHIAPVTESVNAVFAQVRTTESQLENGAIAFGVRYNDADAATATVWNLSGKYNLTNRLYIQGSVSTNFILPSAEQLFLAEPGEPDGNPNLDPEESTNLNVSIGSTNGVTYWQVTGFTRTIENSIDDGYSDAYTFLNREEDVSIDGFELLGGIALSDTLRFEASYLNSETRIDGENRQMQYNPRWHAKASLAYERDRYGARIAARSVSSVYSSQGGSFGLVEHDSYTVADLSAHVWLDQARRQQIVFRIENAFDETYATLRGFRSGSYDDGSGSFLSMLQGLPRTYRISYRYRI